MAGIGAPTGKAFESVFADIPRSGVESLHFTLNRGH